MEYTDKPNAKSIVQKYNRLKQRNNMRDVRMGQLQLVRSGRMSEVSPDLFPDNGPWQEPIVANMIDVAARDMADMISPLPNLSCTTAEMTSEKDRKSASLRTKIAHSYIVGSNLQTAMNTAGDWLVTYGFLPMRVELDFDNNTPVIKPLNPIGSYYEKDRFGRITCFYQKTIITKDELMSQYPEYAGQIKNVNGVFGGKMIELIFAHDKHFDTVIANGTEPVLLSAIPNVIGKTMVRVAERPYVGDHTRGQFDDVLFVQLAKSRFALLAMKAAHDSVNAPIVMPTDVTSIEMGEQTVIRTNNPAGVRRVPLELSAAAFQEQSQLERELQLGSRFPQARTGNVDASIVTGQGVQALMGGYDAQVRTYQAVIADVLREIVGVAFEVDEKIFGGMLKEFRGSQHGTPFSIKYDPAKAIAGDYTVDVTYGLMAGLDPNRWLVFSLQARAEKMFSRDFMRRNGPVDIDSEQQKREIDVEDLEEAAKQAIMGYAQSIPAIASQGQDPSEAIKVLANIMADRRKGKDFVQAVQDAFAKPEPTEEELAMQQMEAMGGQPGMPPQQPGMPGMGGQPGGGQPDLNMMLAGLTAGGQPNLQSTISRRQPI